jgi:hypothetical protein
MAEASAAIDCFPHLCVMRGLDPRIFFQWREITGSSPVMTN